VFRTEPFFDSYAQIESAEAAFRNVLSDAGCNMPEASNHDIRMIEETLNGTTSTEGFYTKKKGLIDREMDSEGFDGLNITEAIRESDWDTDGDGIPNWFETLNGTDINQANNNDDADGDGYTDLEDYLNWVAIPNYQLNDALEIDLSQLFAGYTFPSFTILNNDNINATVTGNVLHLTAQPQTGKLNRIQVKAEQQGVSMTRTLNIACPNGTDHIENHLQEATSSNYYDLQGRPTLTPQRGIYIHQGQKTIKK
jgi:hypothetical protein